MAEFSFPIKKFDDPTGLFKNFRYLEDFLRRLKFNQNPSGYDLVVAASNTKKTSRADVVCSGTADQGVINAAITEYLPAGGSVYFMAGNYSLTGAINAHSVIPVLFQGAGTKKTVFTMTATSTYMFQGGAHAQWSRHIYRDMQLIGYATTGTGILTGGTADQVDTNVENCTISGFATGIYNSRTTGWTRVIDCRIENNTTGFQSYFEGKHLLRGNFFSNNTTHCNADDHVWASDNWFSGGTTGFSTGRGGTWHISNNYFLNITGNAVSYSHLGGLDVILTGNHFSACGTGYTAGWFSQVSGHVVGNAFNNCTTAYAFAAYAASNGFYGTTPVIDETSYFGIDSLTDVTISGTPADNELLAYDSGSALWINQTAAEAGLSEPGHAHTESDISDLVHTVAAVGDITDVTITTIADGELLRWNGTLWVNNTLAEAGIMAVGAAPTAHTHVEAEVTDLDHAAPIATHAAIAAAHHAKYTDGEADARIALANLSVLADTTITAIAAGELLKWDGAAWINNTLAEAGVMAVGDAPTAHTIDGHSNVVITSIADTQVLTWDAGTSKWINATASASVATLNSIGDVTITTVADGELIRWNGSAWINNTLAEAGIASTSHSHNLDALADTTITANSEGEILRWTAAGYWVNNTLIEAGIVPLAGTTAMAGDIIPTTASTIDVGSATKQLAKAYSDEYYVTNSSGEDAGKIYGYPGVGRNIMLVEGQNGAGGGSGPSILLYGEDDSTYPQELHIRGSNGSDAIRMDGATDITVYRDIVPATDVTRDLGSSTKSFKDMYADHYKDQNGDRYQFHLADRTYTSSYVITTTPTAVTSCTITIPSFWNSYDIECYFTCYLSDSSGGSTGSTVITADWRNGSTSIGYYDIVEVMANNDHDNHPLGTIAFQEGLTATGSQTWNLYLSRAGTPTYNMFRGKGIVKAYRMG